MAARVSHASREKILLREQLKYKKLKKNRVNSVRAKTLWMKIVRNVFVRMSFTNVTNSAENLSRIGTKNQFQFDTATKWLQSKSFLSFFWFLFYVDSIFFYSLFPIISVLNKVVILQNHRAIETSCSLA